MKGKLRKAFSYKYYVKKLTELRESPDKLARGLALGVFIGFLPIIGFQVITAVTIALFTRANKVAAAVGTHVTNPWTTIPILILDYYVGCFILRKHACVPHIASALSELSSTPVKRYSFPCLSAELSLAQSSPFSPTSE